MGHAPGGFDLSLDLIQAIKSARGHNHASAFAREPSHGRLAYPRRSAGHYSNLSVEFSHNDS
jgi:hypothetical protein